MTNVVTLVGRLTKDPEHTAGDNPRTTFTLAVNRTFKNAKGEIEADFIRVVVFGKGADNVAKYLSKGSQAAVTGRIQTGSYDKDGTRVYTTDVVAALGGVQFLDTKGSNTKNGENSTAGSSQPNQGNQQSTDTTNSDPFAGNNNQAIEVSDDDLPF